MNVPEVSNVSAGVVESFLQLPKIKEPVMASAKKDSLFIRNIVNKFKVDKKVYFVFVSAHKLMEAAEPSIDLGTSTTIDITFVPANAS